MRSGGGESILVFASVLPLTLPVRLSVRLSSRRSLTTKPSPQRGEGEIRRFVIYTFFETIGREDFGGVLNDIGVNA
jgi:hypothetical protein